MLFEVNHLISGNDNQFASHYPSAVSNCRMLVCIAITISCIFLLLFIETDAITAVFNSIDVPEHETNFFKGRPDNRKFINGGKIC